VNGVHNQFRCTALAGTSSNVAVKFDEDTGPNVPTREIHRDR